VADPHFATRVRASFDKCAAVHTMGMRMTDVEAGRVTLEMRHHPLLTQQHGFLHAGVVSTALDTACGFAASTLMPREAGVLTIEFKVNLMQPARGPDFFVEGVVTKAGRNITFTEGRAYERGGEAGERLIATMTATMMTVAGREGIKH